MKITKYKDGDKVRIKQFINIEMFLDEDDVYKDELFFCRQEMSQYCGSLVELRKPTFTEYGWAWRVYGNRWIWHEDWLESDFLKDEDFEI